VQPKRVLFTVSTEGNETNGRFEYVAIVAKLHATFFVEVEGRSDVGDAESDAVSFEPLSLVV